MRCSLRKVLNLTYAWLFDLIGGTDTWAKEYAPKFDPESAEDFDYVDIPQTPPTPPEVAAAAGEQPAQPASKLMVGGY